MFTEAQNIFVYELNNLMYTFNIYNDIIFRMNMAQYKIHV